MYQSTRSSCAARNPKAMTSATSVFYSGLHYRAIREIMDFSMSHCLYSRQTRWPDYSGWPRGGACLAGCKAFPAWFQWWCNYACWQTGRLHGFPGLVPGGATMLVGRQAGCHGFPGLVPMVVQ